MSAGTIETEFSLLSILENDKGQLNRGHFPMLALSLDYKYAKPGTRVVRWLPDTPIVELSDGSEISKSQYHV